MTILQHMCSQDDPDNDSRRPRPARIVKSRPSTKGKEPAAPQASGHEPEPSQQSKTADVKSIGELLSPTRPTLRARLSSWSIRQKAQAPTTAEAVPDTSNNRFLRRRSSEPVRRPATPAQDPGAGREAMPTLRTRFSAWSLHQRTGEALAVLHRVSSSYQAYFPSGRLVAG